MTWDIALSDLRIDDDDVAAVLDCYRSGWLTMGPRIQALEERFAQAVGAQEALAVSSGSAAMHLTFLATGIGPGDEVILPALTFVAAAGMVRAVGATPVFCDIHGAADLNLDPQDVAAKITPATKAILATHWHGYACDTDALQRLCDEHGLLLIEDAAQAVLATTADGRPCGTLGIAGCFSLFSKKQLAVGEGGMVTTADAEIAAKVRSLRSHAMTSVTWDRHRGHAVTYDILDIGFNYRMDEPRAALGLSRLTRLPEHVERLRSLVRGYREQLADVDGIEVPFTDEEVARGSHFAFAVTLESRERRDAVRERLKADRIQTTSYPSITTFTEYADHPSCPRSEEIAGRHLVLPCAEAYGEREIERVVGALRGALTAA